MPSERPKISYVIASRNDGWCGDPMIRLQNTLDRLVEYQNPDDYEIVIVDWGSEEKISDELGPVEVVPIRYLEVPPKLATERFHESLALNLGIRKARGEWVARLDQDTQVGPGFVSWFREYTKHKHIGSSPALFSLRRDLPEDLVWNNWHKSGEKFWRGAVGILLAPAWAWNQIRGYYEHSSGRYHEEHDLCLRFQKLCGLEDIGPSVGYDFHHQHHTIEYQGPFNTQRKEEVLLQMIAEGKFTSQENWGMKDYWDQIKEVVL